MDAMDIYSVLSESKSTADAMANAASYLEVIGEKIALKYL
jgi:hypothetical protein